MSEDLAIDDESLWTLVIMRENGMLPEGVDRACVRGGGFNQVGYGLLQLSEENLQRMIYFALKHWDEYPECHDMLSHMFNMPMDELENLVKELENLEKEKQERLDKCKSNEEKQQVLGYYAKRAKELKPTLRKEPERCDSQNDMSHMDMAFPHYTNVFVAEGGPTERLQLDYANQVMGHYYYKSSALGRLKEEGINPEDINPAVWQVLNAGGNAYGNLEGMNVRGMKTRKSWVELMRGKTIEEINSPEFLDEIARNWSYAFSGLNGQKLLEYAKEHVGDSHSWTTANELSSMLNDDGILERFERKIYSMLDNTSLTEINDVAGDLRKQREDFDNGFVAAYDGGLWTATIMKENGTVSEGVDRACVRGSGFNQVGYGLLQLSEENLQRMVGFALDNWKDYRDECYGLFSQMFKEPMGIIIQRWEKCKTDKEKQEFLNKYLTKEPERCDSKNDMSHMDREFPHYTNVFVAEGGSTERLQLDFATQVMGHYYYKSSALGRLKKDGISPEEINPAVWQMLNAVGNEYGNLEGRNGRGMKTCKSWEELMRGKTIEQINSPEFLDEIARNWPEVFSGLNGQEVLKYAKQHIGDSHTLQTYQQLQIMLGEKNVSKNWYEYNGIREQDVPVHEQVHQLSPQEIYLQKRKGYNYN